ncbi:MAG: 30S ribosomal protein S7 [Candidatus Doudnabacteria bacterium]|nr:30S ribosomal protein S7 [Candidatus Doudnabacteria bacterium]MCA9387443.1 30S ribosomal protein S7 [Candidatus Andersenbacteria bacterium]
MSRRTRSVRREIDPDPKFQNETVARFINYLMIDGKKSVAQSVVYEAFDIVAEKTKMDPIEIFERALRNVSPSLEVKGRRVGGANYQVPFEVKGTRKQMLAFRWILESARGKSGKAMSDRLASELMAASKEEGGAIAKREDVQRQAEANKAFAHFARPRTKKRF